MLRNPRRNSEESQKKLLKNCISNSVRNTRIKFSENPRKNSLRILTDFSREIPKEIPGNLPEETSREIATENTKRYPEVSRVEIHKGTP